MPNVPRRRQAARNVAPQALAAQFRNRVVGHSERAPGELRANAKNWREHSEDQRAAMRDMLRQVGFVAPVILDRTSGELLDGHLRVALALEARTVSKSAGADEKDGRQDKKQFHFKSPERPGTHDNREVGSF